MAINSLLSFEFHKSEKGVRSLPTLVFIHGSGCTRDFLKPLAKEFTEFDYYLVDLPSHGDSPKGCVEDVYDYIDSVAEFVGSLSEEVILIGHSLGGTIVLGTASRNISNVKGVVGISTGASFPKLDKDFMNGIRKGIINQELILECFKGADECIINDALDTLDTPEVLMKDFIIDQELDIHEDMSDIKVPVLLLTGGDEILTLVEYSEQLVNEIDVCSLKVFEGERHLLPLTKKEVVHDTIVKFINTL